VDTGARLEAIRRLTWLCAGLLLWAAAILAKLITLQVFHHNTYLARARKQQEQSVELSAPRGAIFDRNGRALAMSVPAEAVAVNPRLLPDKQLDSEVLAPILGLDANQLYTQIVDAADHRRGFLYLKHRISDDESERLHTLHADWVLFEPESKRIYPDNDVPAHIVGSVYQGEKGAEGLEKGVDDLLKGTPGKAEMLTDVKKRVIDSRVEEQPVPGKSIKLAIDERLQFLAERELAAQVKLKHGRSGTVIVMNPYTGEILVLANYPTFEPGVAPRTDDEKRAHFNLGAQVPFEPGSIFKVATLSTALETTDLVPTTMINCHNGILKLPGRVVHEAHGGFGMLSMADVLAKSSNIGAIEIGSRIGREKFYEYLTNLGFGQRTGLQLPAESPGILRKLDRWGTTSLASVSMGQEVGATSLQLIRLCAAVANGGLLVKPRLLLEIDGKPVPLDAPKRVLRPETTVTMRTLMEGVVLHGTGSRVIKLNGWTAGGKTGTAQIFEHGHYTHLYNASFMGFAPVTNPALVAIVTINGTTGNAGMGGPTSGPVWSKVMNEALRLYNVPKDLPESPGVNTKPVKVEEFNEVAEVEGDAGKNILEDDPAAMPKIEDVAAEPAGTPLAVASAAKPAASPVAPAPPPVTMGSLAPDFRGKPMRAVVREAYSMGLSIKPEGSGLARTQMPAAGSPVRPGDTIRVLFTR
jgi:cell division protein FtsI (penicillin-binding protein 3)